MSENYKIRQDPRFLILQKLYAEDVSAEELRELLKSPEHRKEYEKFLKIKQQLETPSLRQNASVPDHVLERIFAAARPVKSRFWVVAARRPSRRAVLGGISVITASAATILLLMLTQEKPADPNPQPTSEAVELQWEDTRDRIVMQQTVNVVRQRTSVNLWDESAVMNLDSLMGLSNTSLPGVEAVSVSTQ